MLTYIGEHAPCNPLWVVACSPTYFLSSKYWITYICKIRAISGIKPFETLWGVGHSIGIWVGALANSMKPCACSRHKDANFATLSIRGTCAVISYPVQEWTKQAGAVFTTLQTARTSLRFHAFQRRHTKSAKIMWSKGEERRKFTGTTLFKTRKYEIVYPDCRNVPI